MALAAVVAGNSIVILDLNQIINLLTGAMTDQPVTLGNTLDVKQAATLEGAVTCTSTLAVSGASTLHAVAASSVSSSGAVSGTTGTFTGQVESNSVNVVEGQDASHNYHQEFWQATDQALTTGSHYDYAVTFTRAFTVKPHVQGSTDTTAGNPANVQVNVVSRSTTGATVRFTNTDGATQTLHAPTIFAYGY